MSYTALSSCYVVFFVLEYCVKKNGVVLDESEALVVSRFEMLQTNVGLA